MSKIDHHQVERSIGSSSVDVDVSEDFSTPSSLQSGQELRPVVSHLECVSNRNTMRETKGKNIPDQYNLCGINDGT